MFPPIGVRKYQTGQFPSGSTTVNFFNIVWVNGLVSTVFENPDPFATDFPDAALAAVVQNGPDGTGSQGLDGHKTLDLLHCHFSFQTCVALAASNAR